MPDIPAELAVEVAMLRVIGAPIDSVGSVQSEGEALLGTEKAPRALRDAGLIQALGALDAGDLPVRIRRSPRDVESGVVGWDDVKTMTDAVRASVIDALHAGDLPVVIGGCCSVLPGALAGARDCLGVIALAYVDGHLDLYDGRTSPTGEAADMPIAVVTGVGPEPWIDLVAAPLTPPDGVALLGPRDRPEAQRHGSVMPEEIDLSTELDPETLRDLGMARAGADTEVALTTVAENFWLHLDVDVLDTASMPATDYLQTGGLTFEELGQLLEPLGRSAALAGVSVGCFNPDKADTGATNGQAEQLVALLAGILRDTP